VIERDDFTVEAEPGVSIFVREVKTGDSGRVPVVLLHTVRTPALASFDLPVRNGSIAQELAERGHRTYVMDARGFGRSWRPPEMDGPPATGQPLVRTVEILRDIHGVVDAALERTGADRVGLLGWGGGGYAVGWYASLWPQRVSHLVVHNAVYGTDEPHDGLGAGTWLEDPEEPGRFNAREHGGYRLVDDDAFSRLWTETIPIEDKAAWRDPALLEAYTEAAFAADPTSGERTPRSFRAPCGVMEDAYYAGIGRRLWDAGTIEARVLAIGSELCFWSRPGDRRLLAEHLVHAQSVDVVELEQATHYVHLDRPERGRARFVEEVAGLFAS
jgi:pimeloyl-ACP methyl ester carboxylesterase